MTELEKVFEAVAGYFSLLSEPMRLKIMHAICHEEKSVNRIVQETSATQTSVSRHLAMLYRGGVVARRKEGNQVFYRVADAAMMEICRSVCTQIAERIEQHQPLVTDLPKLMARSRKKAA